MQPEIEFTGPSYETGPFDLEAFRRLILELPDDYWMRGNGQVRLRFPGKGEEDELLISPNKEFGVSLKVFGEEVDWMSLHDRSRLAEITTVSDDWLTSVGLFLPPGDAWVAIEHFCRTGERSPAVGWISSGDMPDDGNY